MVNSDNVKDCDHSFTREPTTEELTLLGLSSSPSKDLPRLSERIKRESLIDRILGRLGLKVDDLSRTQFGNNTKSFILKCERCETHTETDDKAMFLAGTDPLPKGAGPLKVVFCINVASADMDSALLMANRVAAMKLARSSDESLASLIPRIYAWSDGSQQGSNNRQPWCIMEYMPGVPLVACWENLNLDRRILAGANMAKVLARLQSIELPKTDKSFGAFNFSDYYDHNSSLLIGETCFRQGGPFKSTRQLYLDGYTSSGYDALHEKAPRLKQWKGYSVDNTERDAVDLGEALQQLRTKFGGGDFAAGLVAGFESTPVFIHGDFDVHNILIDPATMEIKAVLDFEFTQAGPSLDEYFQSLVHFNCLYMGSRFMSDQPEEEKRVKLCHAMMHKDPPALPGDAEESLKLQAAFVQACKDAGVKGPWSIEADVADRQANLYWHANEAKGS
ncbi:hypothetical protein KCU67_g1500, partial [Aureobasidium melanogenum]